MRLSIDEIKKKLINGNQRFRNNKILQKDLVQKRKRLIKSQDPFAIIIGCSDSRVPPELIFDCNLGDIFTIRVAGNIIDEDVLESIEYAVNEFNCELVLVLGHQNCGAVKMAIDGQEQNNITDKINNAIKSIDKNEYSNDEYYNKAIDENIMNSVKILQQKLNTKVQGAKYLLNTGEVIWNQQYTK